MGEELRCKRCNTPLVIIPSHDNKDSIGFYLVQELFCPKCGKAHAEVKKND